MKRRTHFSLRRALRSSVYGARSSVREDVNKSADFEEERLSPHAAPTVAAFLVLEARHVMKHVVEVTEDSPWHVELVVKLDGLDGALVEGGVVLEVLPINRLGRVVPPLILHDESVRILPMAGLDTPSVPPVVTFFETRWPP